MSFELVPFKSLPNELNFQIFLCLDGQELALCSRVSQAWCALTKDDILWRGVFSEISIPLEFSAKDYVIRHIATTKENIRQRIQNFANKTSLNEINTFRCLFPFNTECKINVVLGKGNTNRPKVLLNRIVNKKPQLSEVCIFPKKLPGLEIQGDGSSMRANSENLGFSILNRRIIPPSESFLERDTTVMLPRDDSNVEFSEQINNILDSRTGELSRNYRYRIAAIVVLASIALSFYLRASSLE